MDTPVAPWRHSANSLNRSQSNRQLILIGFFTLFIQFDLDELGKKFSLSEILILIVALCATCGFWWHSRKLPISSPNKISIVIAINCESKKERQRLRADFVNALKDQIAKGNNQNFDVFTLSDYWVEKIDELEKARNYQIKIRAHLFLIGNCRTRLHQGHPSYVLEIQEMVRHAPIHSQASQAFSKELDETIPFRTIIPEKDEVLGFQISRELFGVGARYALGRASHISGDPITALDIHHGLWKELKTSAKEEESTLPTYQAIKRNLPNLLVTEANQACFHYLWKKPPSYLEKVKFCIDLVAEIDPRNYLGEVNRATYIFLSTRSTRDAKRILRKIKNQKDSSWQFSLAFLEAYEGDLDAAYKYYQKAIRGSYQDHIPNQIEDFIHSILDAEPDKIQLWYCLGLINYLAKGDLVSAKKYFEHFIEKPESADNFSPSIAFAKKYLQKIELEQTFEVLKNN